jgi:hypothetical protein
VTWTTSTGESAAAGVVDGGGSVSVGAGTAVVVAAAVGNDEEVAEPAVVVGVARTALGARVAADRPARTDGLASSCNTAHPTPPITTSPSTPATNARERVTT